MHAVIGWRSERLVVAAPQGKSEDRLPGCVDGRSRTIRPLRDRRPTSYARNLTAGSARPRLQCGVDYGGKPWLLRKCKHVAPKPSGTLVTAPTPATARR